MAGMVATPGPGEERLPALRQDLSLHPGPRDSAGAPTWTLHDPVENRFFRIGWPEFSMLSHWGVGSSALVAGAVNETTPLDLSEEAVKTLADFLKRNHLVVLRDPEAMRTAAAVAEQQAGSLFGRILKNYLFFRIPLIRPDSLLAPLAPVGRFLFTRGLFWGIALAGLVALLLVFRQWDQFLTTFSFLFSWQGVAYAGLAIAFSKIVHEFGHALATHTFGCRVPTMGIAFLVLWPVLYTDTTDAWRLTSRRQRLVITAAGMMAELALAVLATYLWLLLPEGMLRSAVFLLATTTWILTLGINLNPLLRFDGYFLLSDILDMPNLQARSFALARWQLRRWILGDRRPPPEPFERRRQRMLILFAFVTWIYRFFLFLAIAWLVYELFFKILGLFLMLVEIWWFILRPIGRELWEWLRASRRVGVNGNIAVSTALLAALVAAFFVPLPARVGAPALWTQGESTPLYAPLSGRLAEISAKPGQRLAREAPVFRLESPDLAHLIRINEIEITTLKWEAAFKGGDEALRRRRLIAWQELEATREAYTGQLRERENLVVRTPVAGRLVELEPGLRTGDWLEEGERLGLVVGDGPALVTAYVAETDLSRISAGAQARFLADHDDATPIEGRIEKVDAAYAVPRPPLRLLSTAGGPIATHEGARQDGSPVIPVYRVVFRPDDPKQRFRQEVAGRMVILGRARSLAVTIWHTISGVWRRESGF